MSAETKVASAEDFLANEMMRLIAKSGITKRSAARLAIASAIYKGLLPAGSLLPSEKSLASILGISLGTAQAALQQLQQSNVIVRRRGDGTRVASTEKLSSETWHFRLLAKKKNIPLRISKVEVDVNVTSRTGAWSDFFVRYDEFTIIRRNIVMSNKVCVAAEMILPQILVPGLETIPTDELKMVNIRRFLAEKHDLLISKAEHQIETVFINELAAKRTKISPGTISFQITAHAFLSDAKPGYWQRIIVPCGDCRVTF